VKGIREVANEIEVRRLGAHLHSDAELNQRVAAVLSWNAQLPPGRVQAAVRGGVVTLIGEVDWQFQKDLAEDQVCELAGVVEIKNRISVRPTAEVAKDLHARIVRALARHADLDATDITTETDGGNVRLSGHVRTNRERRIAENAAWSAPGVTAVENALRVEPS
jgi:osmotically-inducible protein OsmY